MAAANANHNSGKSKKPRATRSEPTEARPFCLLDLPPEIWSRICRFAVVFCDGVHAIAPRSAEVLALAVEQPSITCVCRAIREEILRTYYAENVFVFSPMPGNYTVSPIFHLGGLATWIAVGRDAGWWDLVREVRVITAGEMMEEIFVRRLEEGLKEIGVGVMWMGFEGAEVRRLMDEGFAGVRLRMRLV